MIELTDVQNMFYNVYNKTTPIEKFETWLYKNDEIENIIGNELYFELLNINYRGEYAFHEVEKLILPHIDFGRSETKRIIDLLKSLIDENGDIYLKMFQLYHDYCKGYYFLRYLGISYAASGDEKEISINGIRKNLLKSNEKFKNEAQRLLVFFEKGELKITGQFKYGDFRKEEDRIELNNIEEMLNR